MVQGFKMSPAFSAPHKGDGFAEVAVQRPDRSEWCEREREAEPVAGGVSVGVVSKIDIAQFHDSGRFWKVRLSLIGLSFVKEYVATFVRCAMPDSAVFSLYIAATKII
jgi:hypothetical protein